MSLNQRALHLAVAAALGFGAGCGGDEESGDGRAATDAPPAEDQDVDTAPAADQGDPAAVFQQFQTALSEGDAGAACALLADAARKQAEDASIGGSCDDWVEELSGVFTDEIRESLRSTPVLEATEDGDRATVRYRSPILDLPLEAELERENGSWRLSRLAEGV